jgi:hypothetical protein
LAKIAHQNDRRDNVSAQSDQSLDQAARAAGARAVAETDRLARAASDNVDKETATSLLDILGDQNRHALEATTALGRARSLGEVVQIQSGFFSGSFGRMGRLSEHYLSVLRGGMAALPSIARR